VGIVLQGVLRRAPPAPIAREAFNTMKIDALLP
jgi:hypothetical protein